MNSVNDKDKLNYKDMSVLYDALEWYIKDKQNIMLLRERLYVGQSDGYDDILLEEIEVAKKLSHRLANIQHDERNKAMIEELKESRRVYNEIKVGKK